MKHSRPSSSCAGSCDWDQGPEFTGKAMDAWAYQRGIELRLIEAGKPTQNAYVE